MDATDGVDARDAPADARRGLSTARAVLQVLTFLAEHPCGASAHEIAHHLHKSRSTAYHLLASLEAEGFVARDRHSGSHRLVVGVPGSVRSEVAPAPDVTPRLGQALPIAMRRVFERSCRRTWIGVLHDGGVELIAEAGRQGIPRLTGLEKPLIRQTAHALAIGKLALAALDAPHLARHIDELGLTACTERTIVDPTVLGAELADVRRRGVAVDCGEYHPAFGSIAAIVRGPADRPVAALAVTVTRAQFAHERASLERLLLTVARELSELAAGEASRPSLAPAAPSPSPS